MADVWLGAQTGILKAVDLNKKESQNFGELSSLNKHDEICQMCWSDSNEGQMFIGIKSGVIKTFDLAKQDFIKQQNCFKPEDGLITGLERQDGTLIACCQSGILRVLKDSDVGELTDIKVGDNITRMRQNPSQPCQVATGGEENTLKLWDLNKPKQPVFKAKNVRNDMLDLRVPIFVKDIGFLSSSGSLPKIIIGTAYHKLQLYDLKAQKRPVLDISYMESPITCVSVPPHEKCIIIGNAFGDMGAIDIRNGKNLGSFKSFSGSINDIQCHKSEPLVASCGQDRFLRIHHLDSRQLVHKIYLKSRLKCLLFSKEYRQESEEGSSKDSKVKRKLPRSNENESCEESDEEDIWNAMDVVEDEVSAGNKSKKPKKKKDKVAENK